MKPLVTGLVAVLMLSTTATSCGEPTYPPRDAPSQVEVPMNPITPTP